MALSQGLRVGRKQGTIRTPPARWACWFCARSQVRTTLLPCHEALSQITTTVIPVVAKHSAHQCKNCVVMALSGLPSTKRSHSASGGAGRGNSP